MVTSTTNQTGEYRQSASGRWNGRVLQTLSNPDLQSRTLDASECSVGGCRKVASGAAQDLVDSLPRFLFGRWISRVDFWIHIILEKRQLKYASNLTRFNYFGRKEKHFIDCWQVITRLLLLFHSVAVSLFLCPNQHQIKY